MTGLLALGVFAVLGALLLLTLVVLPAGPGRVPLSRLDPSAGPPPSALAGAGAAPVRSSRGLSPGAAASPPGRRRSSEPGSR